ncbi:hypothetical protein IT575_05770 [bacterium]|nr:hypothetical protein [bacterium]
MSFLGASAPASTHNRHFFALRPLELKQLFDFALRVYRANLAPMFLTMAVAEFPMYLLGAFFSFKLLQLSVDLQSVSTTGAEPDWSFFSKYLDDLLPLAVFGLLAAVYYLLALPLAYLTCSKLVVQGLINEPWSISRALDYARRNYWPTQGALFLFAMPVMLLALILLLPVLAFSQSGDDGATAVTAVIALLLIWFGVIATWLVWFRFFPALIGAVQSCEQAPPGSVFAQATWYLRRSFELTRGYFWRVFGLITVYLFAVGFFQNGIFRTISTISELIAMGQSLRNGGGDMLQLMSQTPPAESMIVSLVLFSAIGLFFPALQIAYLVLLYLDLRCRKEGLDLELALGTSRIGD